MNAVRRVGGALLPSAFCYSMTIKRSACLRRILFLGYLWGTLLVERT
ncbi:MAG: hypothetical protein QNJ38_13020 [Prochloraceae cyanobacterium]|nr:hypothetical protein [Prochloraceae cyanobacterium]